MNRPRNSAMEREITYQHWLPNDTEHSYTWHNLNVELQLQRITTSSRSKCERL